MRSNIARGRHNINCSNGNAISYHNEVIYLGFMLNYKTVTNTHTHNKIVVHTAWNKLSICCKRKQSYGKTQSDNIWFRNKSQASIWIGISPIKYYGTTETQSISNQRNTTHIKLNINRWATRDRENQDKHKQGDNRYSK